MVVGPSKVRPTPRGHQRKHCTPSLSDTPPEHFLGPGHAGRLCPGVPGLSPGSGTARRQGPARRRRWNGPADLYGPAPAIIERRDRRRCPASWVSGQANTPKRCLKGRDMTCQQPQPRHSGAARPRQECYKELPLGHGCCIAVDAKAVAVQGGGRHGRGARGTPDRGTRHNENWGRVCCTSRPRWAGQAGAAARDASVGGGSSSSPVRAAGTAPSEGDAALAKACVRSATIRERLHGRGLSTAWAVAGSPSRDSVPHRHSPVHFVSLG
jgi:hypothetical protein